MLFHLGKEKSSQIKKKKQLPIVFALVIMSPTERKKNLRVVLQSLYVVWNKNYSSNPTLLGEKKS